MYKRLIVNQFLALSASFIPPAQAVDNLWKIEPMHSSVSFTVKHFGMAVQGAFHNFGGEIVYDGSNLQKAKVNAEIVAESIDTANNRRDNHLKSKKFFDVSQFPKITFKSEKVVPAALGTFDIVGVLNMHGIPEEVTLHVAPLQKKDRGGVQIITTSATAELKRKDFGITMGVLDKPISNNVDIELRIELEKEPVKPASASWNPYTQLRQKQRNQSQ